MDDEKTISLSRTLINLRGLKVGDPPVEKLRLNQNAKSLVENALPKDKKLERDLRLELFNSKGSYGLPAIK